uniref:Uncharacterized protein n=1 Tax=Anguilla anguilla TaxID=7936 RepID=A0A0E9PLB5_ANGAN
MAWHKFLKYGTNRDTHTCFSSFRFLYTKAIVSDRKCRLCTYSSLVGGGAGPNPTCLWLVLHQW